MYKINGFKLEVDVSRNEAQLHIITDSNTGSGEKQHSIVTVTK